MQRYLPFTTVSFLEVQFQSFPNRSDAMWDYSIKTV